MNRHLFSVFAALALLACVKPPLPTTPAPAVTLLGIEVKANDEVRRAGPQAALPVPGTVALLVQVSQPAYLFLARKSGTSAPSLLSATYDIVSSAASGAPPRFPSAGQWLRIDDLSDGDSLCLSAHSQRPPHAEDLCGAASILLRWSRDKGETHPQPPPPAPETKAPSAPPPPPPSSPSRMQGFRE